MAGGTDGVDAFVGVAGVGGMAANAFACATGGAEVVEAFVCAAIVVEVVDAFVCAGDGVDILVVEAFVWLPGHPLIEHILIDIF